MNLSITYKQFKLFNEFVYSQKHAFKGREKEGVARELKIKVSAPQELEAKFFGTII